MSQQRTSEKDDIDIAPLMLTNVQTHTCKAGNTSV